MLKKDEASKAEKFLVNVMQHATTMDDLRYWMYHFYKSHDFDKIPPTSHLTVSHNKRAFYVTHDIITVFDNEASLDPTNFGFQIELGYLIPQKDLRLWPNDLVKECHCKSCERGATCICQSNNLLCISFCKCQSHTPISCKNPQNTILAQAIQGGATFATNDI